MISIKRELWKAQVKKDIEDRFKKAIYIIRRMFCQHKNCYSEIVNITLGNTENSIISELLGKEETKDKSYTVKMKRIRCADCGREIYRSFIED